MRLRAAALPLLLLVACGREKAPEPKPPAAVVLASPLAPWTWHPLGSWAVIEGEVDRDTELRLEGSSIRERRFAELGPVRWEFLRPPEGQTAILLTGEGVELARFTFSTTPASAPPKAAGAPPAPLPTPAPTPVPSRPTPPLPQPSTRSEARLPSAPVPPLSARTPQTLPRTDQAPATRPAPPLPPARARAETFLPSAPVPPLSARTPQTLPRTDQAPPTKPTPALPPARARAETFLPSAPVQPLPERRPLTLPRTDQAPPTKPTPALPPARARAETFLPSAPVQPLPERRPLTLPRTDQAPPTKPTPALPPARARAETYLPSAPIPALPERKPLPLPRTDQAPAARSAAPTLPAWAQIETSLPSTHLTPLAGRRVAASGAPEMAPTPRRGTAAPNLLETLPARPPQTPLPLQTQVPAWPGAGEALNLTRGPAGRKRLLLSFDGGSNAEVATQILDLLKARKVRSTFFLTGAFIQHHPALVRRMAAEGHELGNHTLSHPHFAPGMKRDPKWTRERFQQQLLDADMALLRLLGRPMDPLWRAPYGEHTAELRRWAEEVGYRHVGWSEGADTLDWATRRERSLYRSGEAILERLRKRLDKDGDGLIVLMHLGSERSDGDRPSEGLGAFIDRAVKEGWTFATAGDFVRDLGKPAWDPRQRLGVLGAAPSRGR